MSEKAPHSESVGKDVVKLPSNPDHARELQDRIEALLSSTNATDRDRFCVRLALEEALVNAIKHGNQLDPGKSVTVRFMCSRIMPSSTSPTRGRDSTRTTCPTPPTSRTWKGPAGEA